MNDDFTQEEYQAAIPACCALQTVEQHVLELMLCWGLCAAIRKGEKMDCRGCDVATRRVFFARPPDSAPGEQT